MDAEEVYQKHEAYFQEEFGFKPFRTYPKDVIKEEIADLRKKKLVKFERCVIIKHSLISFFPVSLHSNPLVEYWTLYRLMKGTSFTTPHIKVRLKEYYEYKQPFLAENIRQLSELGFRMAIAVRILFPEGKETEYFSQYITRFAQMRDFITESNFELLDELMDDIWISQNYDIPLDDNSLSLALEIEEALYDLKETFDKKQFWEYAKKNEEQILERNPRVMWIQSYDNYNMTFDYLLSRGAFFYYSNYFLPNLKTFKVVIQFNSNLSLRTLALIHKAFLSLKISYIRINRTNSSEIWVFHIFYHNAQDLERFFMQLQSADIIVDFFIIEFKEVGHLAHIDQNIFFTGFGKRPEDLSSSLFSHFTNEFLWENRQFFADNITEHFRRFLKLKMQNFKVLLNVVKDSEEKCMLSKELVPDELIRGSRSLKIAKLGENLSLTLFESTLYFSLIQNILSKKTVFDMESEYSLLAKLMEMIASKQNLPISNWIPLDQIISLKENENAMKQLDLINHSLQARIHPSYLEPKSLNSGIEFIRTLLKLNKSALSTKLTTELSSLLNSLIQNITFFFSFRAGINLFEGLSFFETEKDFIPILPSITDRTLIAKENNLYNSIFSHSPNTYKLLRHLGKHSGFFLTAYQYGQFYSYLDVFGMYNMNKNCVEGIPFDDLVFTLKNFTEVPEKPPKTSLKQIESGHTDILTTYEQFKYLIPNQNSFRDIPTFPEWKKAESVLLNSKQNPSYLLDRKQSTFSDIRMNINWPRLGLQQYIAVFSIAEPEFSIVDDIYDTAKCLTLPGIQSIYGTIDTVNKFAISYVFPFESPNMTMFHYLTRRDIITDFRLLQVEKIHWNYNITYYVNPTYITTGFSSWNTLSKKIIESTDLNFPDTAIHMNYYYPNSILSRDSDIVQKIRSFYTKNMRKYGNLKIFKDVPPNLYFLLPKMEPFYTFPIKALVWIGPLSSEQINKYIHMFTLLPYSKIYEGKLYNSRDRYILADLRFFHSHIDDFYYSLRTIVTHDHIADFFYIPSVIELTPFEFAKVQKTPSVFNAHTWNNKAHAYNLRKCFTPDGKPLKWMKIN
jgi:hypothetical protein